MPSNVWIGLKSKSTILEFPSFTKGKSQLSGKEVDYSRKVANVRIHIERVIGRLRIWRILNTIIPISQVDLTDDIMITIGKFVSFKNCLDRLDYK